MSGTDDSSDWDACIVTSIGRVSLLWSEIHATAHNTVLQLHHFQTKEPPGSERTTTALAATLYNMEFREIAAAIKMLVVEFEVPEPLATEITSMVNLLDNEFRTERNRYIHDQWVVEGDLVIRFQSGSQVKMLQARTPYPAFGKKRYFNTPDEIWAFVVRLNDARNQFLELENRLYQMVHDQWMLAKSLPPTLGGQGS